MKQAYPHSTAYKFIYRDKADLRGKHEKIIVYYLLHSPVHGYFIFDVDYTRKNPKKTIRQWKEFIEDKTDPTGGWFIFTHKILDAINIRRGLDYTLKDVLAWRLLKNDIRHDQDQKKSAINKTKRQGTK